MAVKGAMNVNKNMKKFVVDTRDVRTPKALLVIAQSASAIATINTPVGKGTKTRAGGNLINGITYEMLGPMTAGVIYRNGFSEKGFNYGFHLHEKTDWKPTIKKNAIHHFLSDAFENPAYQQDYKDIIKAQYEL